MMEVCIDSVASAINAEKGGAKRVELCGNLMEGGTTPTVGMLKVIKKKVQIPVFVMIRPRGGDFLYSDLEMEVMKQDIEELKQAGADGFVIGILNSDGTVDKERCSDLISHIRPRPVTFHRAIDMTPDLLSSLEAVISLGCERVLTSGGEATALDGAPVIRQMVDKASDGIIVMPGGGIHERNLARILQSTGVKEFHCSARAAEPSAMSFQKGGVSMGASLSPPEFSVKVTSMPKVKTLTVVAGTIL
ncbi:copper homeostasis protein cutC homolog [Haliotis rubra]|uniref:copper homeostasis protein cutC homolog n=1 Tax=Haliotis rubra TaxID=36100 RepID=UPI001EE4EDD1|nr:copper homeostasis protein cutC homolog [Haliotis rubra]